MRRKIIAAVLAGLLVLATAAAVSANLAWDRTPDNIAWD